MISLLIDFEAFTFSNLLAPKSKKAHPRKIKAMMREHAWI